jgi:hypothetical protein
VLVFFTKIKYLILLVRLCVFFFFFGGRLHVGYRPGIGLFRPGHGSRLPLEIFLFKA